MIFIYHELFLNCVIISSPKSQNWLCPFLRMTNYGTETTYIPLYVVSVPKFIMGHK